MGRILIVEDDKGTREALGSALAVEGPDMDGLSLLEGLKKEKPDVEVIVVTAYGTVETAVTAMKKGAYDFIEKPIRDLGEIRELVRKAFEKRTLVRENVSLREQLRDKYRFDNIVGNSPRIAEVFQVVAQVAPTQATVLVTGESGTGKELIANAIHYNSLRAGKPFIKVNCASLSETLLESELFGHERGAFTGAVAQRSGRFEIADGGTLFLDEIGTLSPTVQVKLLRVLQEREFERVGGNKPIKVDVRLVVATNRDLGAAVERGEFREDLYYRVNVVKIALPALRERKEDIPLLVAHFISKYSAKNNRNVTGVTDEALELLRAYDYPGNIRELENIIENAVVLTSTPKVTPEVLPAGLRKDAKKSGLISIPVGTDFKEIEKQVIKATLAHTNNNKTRAAAVLGIGVRTLHRKMEQYGLRD
jgi:DNA-binding NtrC family response regulator